MSSVTLDLVSDVQQSIAPYLADTTVRVIAAYLFGSASRGEMTPLSDLDIAVYVDEPKRAVRLQTYASLRQGIEQAMSGLGDYQVDLIVLNDAPPMIAGRAIAGKLLYSADEQHRIAYEARVLDEYQDLLPVHERYDRCLHVRILSGLFGTRSRELIDRQVVNDRLAYIQTTLQQLRTRQALGLETLRHDPDKRGATLYELQTCLEAMADIANHIIAATGLRKPKTRGDAFTILAEANVLSSSLAERLSQAVALRNILVHGYLDMLIDLVYQALHKDLDDVEQFAQAIVRYLQDNASA